MFSGIVQSLFRRKSHKIIAEYYQHWNIAFEIAILHKRVCIFTCTFMLYKVYGQFLCIIYRFKLTHNSANAKRPEDNSNQGIPILPKYQYKTPRLRFAYRFRTSKKSFQILTEGYQSDVESESWLFIKGS